jgi:hypothetical protein
MATQAQCERALDLFEAELSRRKNVVGLGIVPVEGDASGSGRRGLAVAVYVKKKVPTGRLHEKDVVPETLLVPGRNGPIHVPTRIIEQGEVRLEAADKETL